MFGIFSVTCTFVYIQACVHLEYIWQTCAYFCMYSSSVFQVPNNNWYQLHSDGLTYMKAMNSELVSVNPQNDQLDWSFRYPPSTKSTCPLFRSKTTKRPLALDVDLEDHTVQDLHLTSTFKKTKRHQKVFEADGFTSSSLHRSCSVWKTLLGWRWWWPLFFEDQQQQQQQQIWQQRPLGKE